MCIRDRCHRRVGRVGPEYQSSRRGRGEQCRPLRRRVGNMGACPPPHFAVAALLSPETPHVPLAGQRSTRMSISTRRAHGGITSPCARQVGASLRGDHSAHRTQEVHGAIQSQIFVREIPHWWIWGRCAPLNRWNTGNEKSRVFYSSASFFCRLEYAYPSSEKSIHYNMTHRSCCLLYTSPSPRDRTRSRMPSSA